jgi:ribosomal protein L40E
MNYRTFVFSVVLVGFGIVVIATTLFYTSTNGFTGPVQFYETSKSTWTIGFSQGIQAVAVGPSTSTTLTSKNLGTVSLFATLTDVVFIPTKNASLNLFYFIGFLAIVLAILVPFYARNKRETARMKPRPVAKKQGQSRFCMNCGAELHHEASFCNKCGESVS